MYIYSVQTDGACGSLGLIWTIQIFFQWKEKAKEKEKKRKEKKRKEKKRKEEEKEKKKKPRRTPTEAKVGRFVSLMKSIRMFQKIGQ